jgi:hypothetical protein
LRSPLSLQETGGKPSIPSEPASQSPLSLQETGGKPSIPSEPASQSPLSMQKTGGKPSIPSEPASQSPLSLQKTGGKPSPPVGALRSPPPPSHAVDLVDRLRAVARNWSSSTTNTTSSAALRRGGSGGSAPGEGGRRRPQGSDEGEGFPPSVAVQEETAKRAPMRSAFQIEMSSALPEEMSSTSSSFKAPRAAPRQTASVVLSHARLRSDRGPCRPRRRRARTPCLSLARGAFPLSSAHPSSR